MFFLLRCAFWLGLVFANMDWHIDATALPTTGDLSAEAGRQCLANPQACAAIATRAQSIFGAIADQRPQPAVAQKAAPARHTADTLLSTDRAPAWRGGNG